MDCVLNFEPSTLFLLVLVLPLRMCVAWFGVVVLAVLVVLLRS
jgi:hypothetical protein